MIGTTRRKVWTDGISSSGKSAGRVGWITAVRGRVIGDGMTESREAAIRRIEVLIDAVNDLHAALHANEEVYRKTLRLLKSGTEMGKALTEADIAQARSKLADALSAFEADRHRTRSLIIAAQVEEGMNIKQVAQVWGISRQLAGRFLKEIQDDT